MRVWIDLTNSPHVLVDAPGDRAAAADGHEVEVTARDFAQTLQLLERFGLEHTAIGHHRGERLADKAIGLASRSAALVRWARGEHGAASPAVPRRRSSTRGRGASLRHRARPRLQRRERGGAVAAASPAPPPSTTSGRRCSTMSTAASRRRWWCPRRSLPSASTATAREGKVRAYEGLKEEYYLADFEPDAAVLEELGSIACEPIVVVRTPPEVSLYHRFENDLFAEVLARLRAAAANEGVQSVVLPRTDAQRAQLSGVPGFTVPERAIDAQSLIAYADLVISAGGTMNREAVALGTPVYTTFEGRLGAVDERLIADGRLRKLAARTSLISPSARPPQRGAVRRDPRRLLERCSRRCPLDAQAGLLLARVRHSPTSSPAPTCAGGTAEASHIARRGPRIRANAPTDQCAGLVPHPALATEAGDRWCARHVRLLAGVGAALRQWAARPLREPVRTHDLVGTRRELVVLLLSRVYQRRWRYSGQRDYEAVARAVIAIVLLTVVAVAVVRPVQIPHLVSHHARAAPPRRPHHRAPPALRRPALPDGVIVLYFLLSLLLLVGVRVIARSLYERRPLGAFRVGGRSERSVLIVGAGDGGRLVLREILRNRELGLRPVGFVDDDPRKHGHADRRREGARARPRATRRDPRRDPSPTK